MMVETIMRHLRDTDSLRLIVNATSTRGLYRAPVARQLESDDGFNTLELRYSGRNMGHENSFQHDLDATP